MFSRDRYKSSTLCSPSWHHRKSWSVLMSQKLEVKLEATRLFAVGLDWLALLIFKVQPALDEVPSDQLCSRDGSTPDPGSACGQEFLAQDPRTAGKQSVNQRQKRFKVSVIKKVIQLHCLLLDATTVSGRGTALQLVHSRYRPLRANYAPHRGGKEERSGMPNPCPPDLILEARNSHQKGWHPSAGSRCRASRPPQALGSSPPMPGAMCA